MLDAVGNLQTHTSRSNYASGARRVADTRDEDRDALRDWISENLREHGLSSTKAAKAAGMATSTLTKFLKNDPDYTFTPTTTSVAKLERLFDRQAPRSAQGSAMLPQIEAVLVDMPSLPTSRQEAALAALAASRKGIEVWRIIGTALQAAGVLPGDTLLVDLHEQPMAGDIVCAEIHDRGSRRTVFRLFEKPYLVAASFDPTHRQPIVVDDRNVIVRGVVTERLAKRRGA